MSRYTNRNELMIGVGVGVLLPVYATHGGREKERVLKERRGGKGGGEGMGLPGSRVDY